MALRLSQHPMGGDKSALGAPENLRICSRSPLAANNVALPSFLKKSETATLSQLVPPPKTEFSPIEVLYFSKYYNVSGMRKMNSYRLMSHMLILHYFGF